MNHLPGLRVCMASRLFHRPARDETKHRPEETVFPASEDIAKPAKVNKGPTK
jgi:hypothetical protein